MNSTLFSSDGRRAAFAALALLFAGAVGWVVHERAAARKADWVRAYPRNSSRGSFILRALGRYLSADPDGFARTLPPNRHITTDEARAPLLEYSRYMSHEDLDMFADVWEEPFCIEARARRERDRGVMVRVYYMKAWSKGPNKRDEGGTGDDQTFGPYRVVGPAVK